jgi:diguanylate cyclase (GGDEF)-like protein
LRLALSKARRSARSRPALVVYGVGLMALGVLLGAVAPDGLATAALLPVAGVLITIPALRGRQLQLMCILAFGASMAGEVGAYAVGGMRGLGGALDETRALVDTGILLGFTFALICWVSGQLVRANAKSEKAVAAERRALELNERLLETLDPQQVLSVIADSLKSVVRYDNLTIYRVDRDRGLLRPVLARDRFAALILESAFPVERGITGWVVTHGEPVCANDSNHDQRSMQIPGTPCEDESLIVVPLMINGRVGGTLNLGRMGGPESYFDEHEFGLAQLFARQASIAMQNAEAHFALWTRAETDALTGLRNRGAFEEDLQRALADGSGKPITLLMLDLDAFKSFNDRHGHRAGDNLLSSIARLIDAGVRAGDRAYRYGGDEFAVVLPGASEKVGTEVARRINATIAASMSAAGVNVTASIGAASVRAGQIARETLIESADAALYRAKAMGGNRVVVSERRSSDRTGHADADAPEKRTA